MPDVAQETALSLARKAAQHMQDRGLESARLDAELLLAHLLGISRLELYLQFDRPIDATELEQFRTLVRRRLRREPLQYILGKAAFRKLELAVDRRVLIPRPETEILVEEVLQWLNRSGRTAPRVLDLGTGSGAIALSLAHEGSAQVIATDLSPEALAVAGENVRRLQLAGSVELRAGALWAVVAPEERFAAVVANPPYIAEAERSTLPPEVRDWEPASALFAGDDGLAVIRAIVTSAIDHLVPGGLLALEIGAAQGPAVLALVESRGGYRNARVGKDLAGRERIMLAEAATE